MIESKGFNDAITFKNNYNIFVYMGIIEDYKIYRQNSVPLLYNAILTEDTFAIEWNENKFEIIKWTVKSSNNIENEISEYIKNINN